MNIPASVPGPRRILIFSLVYVPRRVGGAEVAVKEITDRIPATDIEFDMITLAAGPDEARTERVGNVRVHRIFRRIGIVQKLLYPFAAYRLARTLHADRSYDAVWSIMASYAGYAAYLFKKRHPNHPLILTIQEGDHFGLREGMLGPLFKKIFRAADRIQCISNYLAVWSQHMGATCPIQVVPNGVDFEHFASTLSPEKRQALRAENGFGPNDTVLVTASRLVFKNAVDDIIFSLTDLDASFKLLILGTGPDEAKLRAQAERQGLTGRVVFKGYQPHPAMADYLKASDIFVRPSRTEGLGNSFLEAMAAGIPVIATPVGGIPDFLTDGETGLFCEAGNPRSIALRAEKLVKDRESRDYIVRKAREMIRDKYTWDQIAVRMKTILLGTR